MTIPSIPMLAETATTTCAVCGKPEDDHFLHNTVAGVVAGTYGPDGNTVVLCGALAVAMQQRGWAASDLGPMAYAGRNRGCGCVVQIVVDDPKRPDNADRVSAALIEMTMLNLAVERMSIEAARQAFTVCTHQEQILPTWPQTMSVQVEHIGELIELAAALDYGNGRIGSEAVRLFLEKLRGALAGDTGHYLVLRTFESSDDDFTTCGTALGVADHYAQEGATKVVKVDQATCPNCNS